MSDFRSVLMCAWFLSVLSLGALFWGSCQMVMVMKSPFLRFDGDHPNTNCKPMKNIANMTGNIFNTTIYSHLVCKASSLIPPSVQSTISLVFVTMMATFFQLQHVSTLPIMLLNFNHLQYWQNKKRLSNHLGERGYGQPMSVHHFWRDVALHWHWHRFLSVTNPHEETTRLSQWQLPSPTKKLGSYPLVN